MKYIVRLNSGSIVSYTQKDMVAFLMTGICPLTGKDVVKNIKDPSTDYKVIFYPTDIVTEFFSIGHERLLFTKRLKK